MTTPTKTTRSAILPPGRAPARSPARPLQAEDTLDPALRRRRQPSFIRWSATRRLICASVGYAWMTPVRSLACIPFDNASTYSAISSPACRPTMAAPSSRPFGSVTISRTPWSRSRRARDRSRRTRPVDTMRDVTLSARSRRGRHARARGRCTCTRALPATACPAHPEQRLARPAARIVLGDMGRLVTTAASPITSISGSWCADPRGDDAAAGRAPWPRRRHPAVDGRRPARGRSRCDPASTVAFVRVRTVTRTSPYRPAIRRSTRQTRRTPSPCIPSNTSVARSTCCARQDLRCESTTATSLLEPAELLRAVAVDRSGATTHGAAPVAQVDTVSLVRRGVVSRPGIFGTAAASRWR